VREKLDMLTLRCLCRVVGLGQLGSRHVVGNGRFRGHSVCTLYNGPKDPGNRKRKLNEAIAGAISSGSRFKRLNSGFVFFWL